jgi:hypothetical protein
MSMTRSLICVAGVLAIVIAGRGAAVGGDKGKKAPAALVDVGEFGENLYDFAKAKDWDKAAKKWAELQAATKELGAELKDSAKRLAPAMDALGKAVTAKDRVAAMKAANQVTLIAADLSEPYNPQVPAAVTRLDHFGRELEIGVETKDAAQLKAGAEGLRKNWDSIKAAVKNKGGDAEAKRFEELVSKAAAAKTVDDYRPLVMPILDEVDNLEKVFKK